MAEFQLFQGVLEFPDRATFSRLMQEIQDGPLSDAALERADYQANLIGGRILLLNRYLSQPATTWFETCDQLEFLAAHAIAGRICGYYFGPDETEVLEYIAAGQPAKESLPPANLAPKDEFLPLLRGTCYDFIAYEEEEDESLTEVADCRWQVLRNGFSSFGILSNDPSFTGVANYFLYPHIFSRNKAVYRLFSQSSQGNAANELPEKLWDAGAAAGSAWLSQTPDGFSIFYHEGFHDLESAFGKHPACLKIVQRNFYFPQDRPHRLHSGKKLLAEFPLPPREIWLAKGIGPVKIRIPGDSVLLLRKYLPGN